MKLNLPQGFPLPVYENILALPSYTTGNIGPWFLGYSKTIEVEDAPSRDHVLQYGYSTGLGLEQHVHYLRKPDEDGKMVTWMSTSRLEQESHVTHVRHATGTVVIVGGGLGMVLKAVSDKPDVRRVILIERDPLIWTLITEHTDFASWSGRDKITCVIADALSPSLHAEVFTQTGLKAREADYLYVDIWEHLGLARDEPDTRAIQAQIQAKRVGFWGQELAFVSWCSGQRRVPGLDLWDRYQLKMGCRMFERSVEYMRFCMSVALYAIERKGLAED